MSSHQDWTRLWNELMSSTFVVTFIPGNDSLNFKAFGFFWWSLYFEACVSLVPLAVLLYCYVTYCPGYFCKSGCSFYVICSYELDRECNLVNVIVFLNWLVRSAHFCYREHKGDVCCLCSCSLISLFSFKSGRCVIFKSNLFCY
jgi:hypothetical protein